MGMFWALFVIYADNRLVEKGAKCARQYILGGMRNSGNLGLGSLETGSWERDLGDLEPGGRSLTAAPATGKP